MEFLYQIIFITISIILAFYVNRIYKIRNLYNNIIDLIIVTRSYHIKENLIPL